MSRSTFSSRARRRGQALLLAVLIMIFAALLSASFLVVVSVNLNQTARQSDKSRAAASAKSGLDYINNRLTYSPEGDRWFDAQYPQGRLASLKPASNNYYSALDMAQGWAGDYAKFPDPRQISQGDGPQFLARVTRIDNTLSPLDPDFGKSELFGSLRISVIGLSSDDPTAYSRLVAYKGGFARSPIGGSARFVSNWDFKRNVVPVALANVASPATNTLTVTRANSDFSQIPVPFAVTISNPAAGIPARAAVVMAVGPTMPAAAGSYALTLSTQVTAAADERVELAANLGAPSGINLNNVSTPPTLTPIAVNLSDTDTDIDSTQMPAPNQVDGARVNGSLIYSGNLNAARLRPVAGSFQGTGLIPGLFLASGVIAPDNLAPAPAATPVATINIAGSTGSGDTLQASAPNGIFASGNVAQRNQVVSDGWDRLSAKQTTTSTGRTVSNIRPPDIATGAGVERYRNMARYSVGVANATGTVGAQSNGALYGYGTGIYINNSQDKESKSEDVNGNGALDAGEDSNGNGVLDVGVDEDVNGNGILDAGEDANGNGVLDVEFPEMTQAELMQMWLSTPSTAVPTPLSYWRNGTAAAVTTKASLEQKHLRGWVTPDEFRARGVEVVLGNVGNVATGAPIVIVTRDARDDATPMGASTASTWKDSSGNNLTGTYTQTLSWPTTGVIFAEGNVRIKGIAVGAPNSLTVVSMGNIYIEDSLQLVHPMIAPTTYRDRKILLMAKKNVVVNPTRVMGRPDVQTTVNPGTATVGTASLTVGNTDGFQVGDVIETTSAATTAGTVDTASQITAIPSATSLTVNVLYVSPSAMAMIPPGSTLRSRNSSTSTAGFGYDKINGAQDAIQRRFTLPVPMPNLRLAFAHDSNRTTAMGVTTEALPPVNVGDPPFVRPTTSKIYLTNKQVFTTTPTPAPTFMPDATGVETINKVIRGDFTEPGIGSPNTFPTPAPTAQLGANAQTLAVVGAAMDAQKNIDAAVTPPIGWHYKTTVSPAYQSVPFFYLAGIGNRYDYGKQVPAPAAGTIPDWRPYIDKSNIEGANTYNVPLATSVGIWLNGAQPSVQNEHWNTSMATPAYDTTSFFGFNPNFVTSPTPMATPQAAPEDILTTDQSFYQTDPKLSTLDSRSFLLPSPPIGLNTLSLRQSDNLMGVSATSLLPEYRVLGIKLEDVALNNNASTIKNINPARTLDINAFVYAQNGSWFVIPGTMFDNRLRGDEIKNFLDLNGNGVPDTAGVPDPGEYLDVDGSGAWSPGDFADLNRNGTIEDSEKYAMARYSRYNYQINFTGAIAENRTALVNTVRDPTNNVIQPGAVDDWMNKWVTTKVDLSAATPFTNSRIHFIFDPTIAANQLQPDDPSTPTVDESDTGFRLPQTSDLFYQD